MSLYRAEKLMDLACSTTHDEEARTAALAACRLIRKHGLRLTADPGHAAPRHARRESAPQSSRAEEPREKPPNGGAWTRARRAGRCGGWRARCAGGGHVYLGAGAVGCPGH